MDVDACYRCKPFVLQCSPVERASRSLAETGLFFRVFEVLLSCLFSVRFLEGAGRVFWRPFGSFWINFEVGVIFVTFGWIRWISENVSFTVVKH